MHTSYPTPIQPAEKLTAPGPILSVDIFVTKLSLLAHQVYLTTEHWSTQLTKCYTKR